MSKTDEITNKLVGMLIEVLHGGYSDVRDLAVVQLVLFGNQAIPALVAYMKKEEALEEDIACIYKSKQAAKTSKDREANQEAKDAFNNKWGSSYEDMTYYKLATPRSRAEEGALRALSLLGMENQLKQLFPVIVQRLGEMEDYKRHLNSIK